ncbi:hypothetical protein [Archangium lansingense]|uniref:Lipoprotein n=1 Tax=Archangium lansingense TaxID=2995310 RepID=A0ABT4A5I1_9BACT|nr:hypothetical protein [Archangium lansinium]MCY1076902.1 hypothetical protein [Archangium lansinium]
MRAVQAMFIVVGVLCAVPARAAAPVEAGKVYSGSEGEQVAVVPLSPVESKKALLQVQGTGSELDGKVLPYEVDDSSGDNAYYRTELRGRRWSTLIMRSSGGGRRIYYLNVPGRRDGITVTFDEARTKTLKGEDVYAQHQKQKADGTVTRLMAFDRKAETAQAEKSLSEPVKSMNAACGTSATVAIDWNSISDELLKTYSISSYCESPFTALEKLCASPEGKKAVQAQVKEVSCRFGDAMKLEVQGGKVAWTTAKDAANQEEFATKYYTENLESARGQGEKLAERLRLEQIRVCTDGKGHYVAMMPHETQRVELAYGDAKRLVKVASPPWVLTGYHFLEPRFFNKTMNPSFRGLDMRVYSEVELDEEKKTCAVRCGAQTIPFTLLESEKAQELVQKATIEPNPQKFVPYALLRDQKGRYYLVERGFHQSEERSFRVSIGPKGGLQQQKMTDIVSDSEGEIFATKKGELRLLVDRAAPSSWIENKKKIELRAVPIEENLPLIYNELGVYTGARLGTPCDDQ